MEKDNEAKGEWNSYYALNWEYDPRAVTRWNTDPKPTAGVSPYAVFNGNPILYTDPLGDSGINPIMPRHPIEKPSDAGYLLYNVIGTVVNGVQALVTKGGDYVQAASKADPVAGINNQVSSDYNSVKGFVNSQIDYFKKTPNKQIAADAKAFFTNPDNYFNAAEQVIGGVLSFRNFSLGTDASFAKINVAKDFSLKSSTVAEEGVQYTKSSLKLGQEMHQAYKVGAEGIKEFRLPSGRRIDFLDIKNSTIYELKPFNPRAIKAGENQLNIYMKELQSMPQFKGINWKTVLDTY